MLAINKRMAVIKIASVVTDLRIFETERSQNQRSSGTDNRSAKLIRIRISHPEQPNAKTVPIDTNVKESPFRNTTGKIRNSADKETAAADNKKGNSAVYSRLTIDTGPNKVPRIMVRKEGPAAYAQRIPVTKPAIQKNARIQ